MLCIKPGLLVNSRHSHSNGMMPSGGTEMNRREFIIGCGAVVGATALPLGGLDPLVRCITYQSWPFDQKKPIVDWYTGSIGSLAKDAKQYRLSKMLRPHMTYYKVHI